MWSCDDCDKRIVQSQLKLLLDCIPHLTKLSFVSWPNSFNYWPFIQMINRSIHRVEVESPAGSGYSQVYKSELCEK